MERALENPKNMQRKAHGTKKPGYPFGEPGSFVFLTFSFSGRGEGILATSYFRTTLRRTIIGAAAFHFRVRNGNGWGHCAMITRGTRGRELGFAAFSCGSHPVRVLATHSPSLLSRF